MNKYEAMFILKADLPEEEKKKLLVQISDAVVKHSGTVQEAAVWQEKRRLCFSIKKQQDGMYYLLNFSAPSAAIAKLKYAYKLNEGILRVLFTRL
jgi:small subunit ribosomal protein S6